jgi:hypothetical protein
MWFREAETHKNETTQGVSGSVRELFRAGIMLVSRLPSTDSWNFTIGILTGSPSRHTEIEFRFLVCF